MSTAIHLAGSDDLDRVIGLMERFHEERALPHDDAHRRRAAMPLLNEGPFGAVWLIGPMRAPLGYVLVTFGWSVELGGMEGWVSEIFIRPSVRRRGIGTEVLHAVAVSLARADVKALHVHLDRDDAVATRFCVRTGFVARERNLLMTHLL